MHMVQMFLHLCLASVLSGVLLTPAFAMAQDEAETSGDTTTVEATTPPSTSPANDLRGPAADSPATAAPTPAASNAVRGKGEKVKNLNFEDELVQGAADKPELFYLFQKKNFNYKRLIKLRENFLPEMRKTSEEVQRVRSQD